MNPLSTAASAFALIAVVVTFGYGLACWVDPFPRCRQCTGSGRRRARLSRSWRNCRACRGTGHRLRLGRRAANVVRRLHQDAHH